MTEVNPVYRALRPHKHYSLPSSAPIAAQFEDCRQCFTRLCLTLKSADSTIPYSSIADDTYGKFLAWGNDSGAASRNLDYTLRKTTNLRNTTLELLSNLDESLKKAISRVQKVTLRSKSLGLDEVSDDPDPDGKKIHFEDVKESIEKADSKVADLIEHIDGTVACLMRLIPSLNDPFPVDEYSGTSTPSSAHPDIDLAATLFPAATQALLSRLGKANWRRRRYLKLIKEKGRTGVVYGAPKHIPQPKRSVLQEVAVDAFNFQKPVLKVESLPSQTQSRIRNTTASSVSGGTDTSSNDGSSRDGYSIFSAPKSKFKSAESTTSFPVSEVEPKKLTVPLPPVPLERGRSFPCPYCRDEIDVGVHIETSTDWDLHVFKDLEPYMCTFDSCLRAEKTWGMKDDWFRHELESHRILKVWVCQSCISEFTTPQSFEEHLQEFHDSIRGPKQLAMMVSLCMKHSEKRPGDQVCPLCGLSLKMDSLKEHIANHLEQLALTSLYGDESSEEDDIDDIGSQRFDDTASEGRTKLAILEDFVEEQLGLTPPHKKGPVDTGMDESVFDFVRDSDEEDSEEEDYGQAPTASIKGLEDDSRGWRVRNFLNTQKDERARRARSPRLAPIDIGSALNQMSSSVPIAPFRTAPSHPRDEDFVGRDVDLVNLYKILSVPGRLCTVSATGGMGKTATAVEFSYRYEQLYQYIFWAQAETRVGCADAFSLIAAQLQLGHDGAVQDQAQLIELSKEFLEKTDKRWLLVFDNVDEWGDIEEYIPVNVAKTRGSLLITTRSFDFGLQPMPPNYFRIDLKEMNMEESRRMLVQCIRPDLRNERIRLHPEWRVAGEIASLAGLPLAISQIAGYVKTSGCTLTDFMELWNEWRRNTPMVRTVPGPAASSYAALETIWNIGLSELSNDTLKLLKIMAFVDSDGISKDLLINDHSSTALAFLTKTRTHRFRSMVEDLRRRRLITFKTQDKQEVISIHRLLQHRLLNDMDVDTKERDEIFNLAFELVRERLPRPSIHTPEPAKWNDFKEYIPHVLALQRIYTDTLQTITPFVKLAELFRDAGVHLWQRGLIYDGYRLLNTAESILDTLDVQEEQLRADIHITTSLLIQYFGISHRAESRDRFKKILTIRENVKARTPPEEYTEDDEMLLYNAMADYGNSLLQFNRYKEAEEIYERCRAKYEEWGTEEDTPFEFAKFYHHLAFCRMYHEDWPGAIEMAEKAIELITRHNGQMQLILRFKFDLACIVLQSGDLARSLEMQEQILKVRLQMQGKGKASYFTLQSYYAVGALYAHLGQYDQAEKWFRTALAQASERAGKGFWPEAAVARTEFHLSQVLRLNGKNTPETERYESQARSTLSRFLPYDPLNGVTEEDAVALFDHLQPVFGGRFTGTSLLKYVK
ncbi:nb-arc domain-containing protein [Xylogone sp. PMI_703]|nr:nb-arc domain-containing protein [Xylogone sp. PMI_703]